MSTHDDHDEKSRAEPVQAMVFANHEIYIYIYMTYFSGEGNFQAKLKKNTQQTVLVSIFFTFALFFVSSASFWRHVFYREFAACFCVMFSGETGKKTSFQGPVVQVYTVMGSQIKERNTSVWVRFCKLLG